MKSKRATKETRTRISGIATAMKANTHEIPIIGFAGRLRHAGGQCHPCASCVKCHLCCHAIVGTRPWSDVDEAPFVAENSWQRNCRNSVTDIRSTRKPGNAYVEKSCRRIVGDAGEGWSQALLWNRR